MEKADGEADVRQIMKAGPTERWIARRMRRTKRVTSSLGRRVKEQEVVD